MPNKPKIAPKLWPVIEELQKQDGYTAAEVVTWLQVNHNITVTRDAVEKRVMRKRLKSPPKLQIDYKQAPLEKLMNLINNQIDILLYNAQNGILGAKEASSAIAYGKFLTEVKIKEDEEKKQLKKLTPLQAQRLLEQELSFGAAISKEKK
jgi:predicted transcriptional regulator